MLSGRTVLVTDGTGTIGAALCELLGRQGAQVAFTHLDGDETARLLCDTLEDIGCRCMAVPVASIDRDAIEALVDGVEQGLGPVDGLVNAMGDHPPLPFAMIEEEHWDALLETSLKRVFLFCKAAARGMAQRRFGAIVNIGMVSTTPPVHLAAALAGVEGLSRALGQELRPFDVRVNAVTASAGEETPPEEVARLVTFLLSDGAADINAQVVPVGSAP